jgi:hypothetical protein
MVSRIPVAVTTTVSWGGGGGFWGSWGIESRMSQGMAFKQVGMGRASLWQKIERGKTAEGAERRCEDREDRKEQGEDGVRSQVFSALSAFCLSAPSAVQSPSGSA